MGFTEQQILFAIEINGYNEVSVQNFLFEQMWDKRKIFDELNNSR
jgi:hypothetical protein